MLALIANLLSGVVPFVMPALMTSVKQFWKFYLIGLFGLAAVGTTYEWQHTTVQLKTEKASHAADIKSYKDAQADAEDKIIAKTDELNKQSEERANAADKSYAKLLASYRANLVRFKANQGVRGGPGDSQLTQAPEGVDGPSTGSDVPSITITLNDAQVCATNTARLQTAHDWALTLDKPIDKSKNP